MRFKVYQDAKKFYHRIRKLTKSFPRECWELGDQMRRSSLSVVLNIAEGAGKATDKEFNRYLVNSLGSINETAAGIDVSCDASLISVDEKDALLKEAKSIADQLGGFSKKLKSS